VSASRCALLIVFHWCLHGVQVVSRWCSAASMLIQGVHGVLVVSWRRRVGGVGAVGWWSLVVCLWCFPARHENLISSVFS